MHARGVVSSTQTSPLTMTLRAPERVHTGERVAITVIVANAADIPLGVVLPGRPTAYDVIVSREPDGPPIWRRLEGQIIPLIAAKGPPMGPGDSVVFVTEWDQHVKDGTQVPPGTYYVRAEFDHATAYRTDHTLYWRGPLRIALSQRVEITP